MLEKLRDRFNEFPKSFRILVSATFIDRLGAALIFPFLSLYVAQKFDVGMTEIGLLLAIWSISGLVGSMIGGALSDRYGRKSILIFGLLFSAGTSILMGLATDIRTFYLLSAISGVFADMGHPAQQAMVADLLPSNQRAEGFSILRVVANLSITFGPLIGGLLSGVSYLLLFIIDAIASSITAMIVLAKIPETKPVEDEHEEKASFLQTIVGYKKVARDKYFVAFILASILMLSVYTQMYSTLSVFLYQVHEISAQSFGLMMSMNAAMVVLFQFWVSRKIKRFHPMIMMILANVLYGLGFGLFAVFNQAYQFFALMAVITIGEMIHIPVSQALASSFAPADMRGRYMAAFGISWAVPNIVAPLLAGLVMDNLPPENIWIFAGLIATIATGSFAFLYVKTKNRFSATTVIKND